MYLYNTPTKKIQEFIPQDKQNVKIYTCGPTVYSFAHIGNFAAYIYWDLLVRLIKTHGWTPNRVMNITDVGHLTSDGDEGDDKMEKGAKRAERGPSRSFTSPDRHFSMLSARSPWLILE